MIQKEVGDRIVSPPGSKSYGSLSVMVQTYFEVFKICRVPAQAFRPKPKVESVVIKLVPTGKFLSGIKNEKLYEKVVKSSFSSRQRRRSPSVYTPTSSPSSFTIVAAPGRPLVAEMACKTSRKA